MFSAREVFKYDVIELIRAVELRPCLWDKTLENYKDKLERKQAWQEIFASLEDKYETMSAEEKRKTGEHIVNKWTNIRDTFIKSLRVKMGRPKKRYIWHNFMKFLIKVVEIPEDESANTEQHEQETEVSVSYLNQETEEADTNCSTRKRKKIDCNEEYIVPTNNQAIDFVEVEEAGESRVMNEDEAFFASLLPTVVKYNEDERLEFRIEVLGVMKKIKQQRNNRGGN